MFSIKRLAKSFRDALRGLAFVFKSEQNFRIQILIAVIIMAAAAFFPLKAWEIILLMLLILLVLLVEILNTAIEYFNDLLKPRLHHYVFIIKDIMAGAVLLTSVVALMIGIIIFLPYFVNSLK